MLKVRASRPRAAARWILSVTLTAVLGAGCGSRGFFRPFEYDEDIHLSLDGSATVYVNASLAALAALRGAALD